MPTQTITDINNVGTLQLWKPVILAESTVVGELYVENSDAFNVLSGFDGTPDGMILITMDLKVSIYDWTNNLKALFTKDLILTLKNGRMTFSTDVDALSAVFTAGDADMSGITVALNTDGGNAKFHIIVNRSGYARSEDVAVSATAFIQHLFIK